MLPCLRWTVRCMKLTANSLKDHTRMRHRVRNGTLPQFLLIVLFRDLIKLLSSPKTFVSKKTSRFRNQHCLAGHLGKYPLFNAILLLHNLLRFNSQWMITSLADIDITRARTRRCQGVSDTKILSICLVQATNSLVITQDNRLRRVAIVLQIVTAHN